MNGLPSAVLPSGRAGRAMNMLACKPGPSENKYGAHDDRAS